jgi:hypothetical protein
MLEYPTYDVYHTDGRKIGEAMSWDEVETLIDALADGAGYAIDNDTDDLYPVTL